MTCEGEEAALPHSEAHVIVLGGGSYIEHLNPLQAILIPLCSSSTPTL